VKIFPEFPQISLATSTIADGNMSFKWGDPEEVWQNRRKFFHQHHLALESCVVMEVEHLDKIVEVSELHTQLGIRDDNTAIKSEALVTATPNIFLFLLTADCLPITFFDPVNEVVSLAHLSRKSSGLHVCSKLIHFLSEKCDTKANDLRIHIGPGIHSKSYIHDHLTEEEDSEWEPFIQKITPEQFSMDLVGFNIDQLIKNGVPRKQILESKIDTGTSPEYFSHRHAKKKNVPEGRFATVVGITQ
jgi:copper oxidase (laccase) domain-containing protein